MACRQPRRRGWRCASVMPRSRPSPARHRPSRDEGATDGAAAMARLGGGFGARQSLSGDAVIGSASFNDRAAGGSMGVDHLVNPDLLLGIAAGGSSATFSVDDRATSGTARGRACRRLCDAAVRRELSLGADRLQPFQQLYDADHQCDRPGRDRERRVRQRSARRTSRNRAAPSTSVRSPVTPFAAVQAARLWQGGLYRDQHRRRAPGVLGLSYAAKALPRCRPSSAPSSTARFDFGNGMVWMPFVHAAWVHEFDPSRDHHGIAEQPAVAGVHHGGRACGRRRRTASISDRALR